MKEQSKKDRSAKRQTDLTEIILGSKTVIFSSSSFIKREDLEKLG